MMMTLEEQPASPIGPLEHFAEVHEALCRFMAVVNATGQSRARHLHILITTFALELIDCAGPEAGRIAAKNRDDVTRRRLT